MDEREELFFIFFFSFFLYLKKGREHKKFAVNTPKKKSFKIRGHALVVG
jgi:hypothetical protein